MSKRKLRTADGVVLFVVTSGAIGSCVGGGAMADAGHQWTGIAIFAVGGVLALFAIVQVIGIALMVNDDGDK